jgi:hypothetical protein
MCLMLALPRPCSAWRSVPSAESPAALRSNSSGFYGPKDFLKPFAVQCTENDDSLLPSPSWALKFGWGYVGPHAHTIKGKGKGYPH